MKTIKLILALTLATIAVQCEEFTNPFEPNTGWVEYTIYPKGTELFNAYTHWDQPSFFRIANGHRAYPGYYLVQVRGDSLGFEFCFKDTSHRYDIGEDQSDWNKLYGIVDYWNKIHDYSFRFGWRWFNNELQIGYYVHLRDTIYKGFMYPTDVGEVIRASIEIEEGKATLTLDSE